MNKNTNMTEEVKINKRRGFIFHLGKQSKFPLFPYITLKRADKYSTKQFVFHWLFFEVWTLDSFQFELSIVMDDNFGIGVAGIFPYLRWVMCIPIPDKVNAWVYDHLWLKPKQK